MVGLGKSEKFRCGVVVGEGPIACALRANGGTRGTGGSYSYLRTCTYGIRTVGNRRTSLYASITVCCYTHTSVPSTPYRVLRTEYSVPSTPYRVLRTNRDTVGEGHNTTPVLRTSHRLLTS